MVREEGELALSDMEKIVKGLQCCCCHIKGMSCQNCPYCEPEEDPGITQCTCELAYDALELVTELLHDIQYWAKKYEEAANCEIESKYKDEQSGNSGTAD